LIHKNPEMASESLVKFSSLLRYQLYECNSTYISLKNELAYIESFIELENLRQNDNFDLELKLPKLLEDTPIIAPFILIPFIENAFKHLSEDALQKKWIALHVSVEKEQLYFELSNSANFEIQHHMPEGVSYNGLGLKNVKRRLYLVYKDAHSVIIKKSKDTYTVKLQLTLAKDVMGPLKKISV
jgi:LytS/YehU family sensor histidine kinase